MHGVQAKRKSVYDVLILYFKLRDWDGDDYLFPTGKNMQRTIHSLQFLVRYYRKTPSSLPDEGVFFELLILHLRVNLLFGFQRAHLLSRHPAYYFW